MVFLCRNAPSSPPFSGFLSMLSKLVYISYRCLQRLIVLEGVALMVADTATVSASRKPSGQARSLSVDELKRFIELGDAPYCENLVDRLSDDRLYCFGVESDNHLLSFAWFHIGSAEADMNYGRCKATATAIQLEPEAAFVFHAYTALQSRGKRLMAEVLAEAARYLKHKNGVEQFVATTELVNKAARYSFARAAFVEAGSYWRFGLGRCVGGKYPMPASPILGYEPGSKV